MTDLLIQYVKPMTEVLVQQVNLHDRCVDTVDLTA